MMCCTLSNQRFQKAGKNDEDLLDLAESIGKTMKMVQDTVMEHGRGTAPRFRGVCTEFEK